MKKLLVGVVALLILAGLGVAAGKETYRRMLLEREIAAVETELQNLKNQKEELEGKIAYLQDPANVEREAKTRLNLKRPGEEVILVVKKAASANAATFAETPPESFAAGVRAWWNFFIYAE